MPFSVFLNSVIGFGLGHLVVAVTKPPPHLVRTTVACCTIGNMGNLPLVLITAICANSGSIFGAHCSTQGVAYSSYGMLVSTTTHGTCKRRLCCLIIWHWEVLQIFLQLAILDCVSRVSIPSVDSFCIREIGALWLTSANSRANRWPLSSCGRSSTTT